MNIRKVIHYNGVDFLARFADLEYCTAGSSSCKTPKHQQIAIKVRKLKCGVRGLHKLAGIMAKISWLSIILFLWLSVLISETAMVKIHRAVPRNAKTTRAETDSSWFTFEPCRFLPDLSKIFVKKEAWLYTIPATILVGMCGVFPLLVIPVETGHALREGGK